jgi:chloramphenicol-sensitive protein RarD
MTDEFQRRRSGLLLGLGAYLLWALLPLYFKALAQGRGRPRSWPTGFVWSLVFLAALVTAWKRWPAIRAALRSQPGDDDLDGDRLADRRELAGLHPCGGERPCARRKPRLLSPIRWSNVLLGVVLLKERLSRRRSSPACSPPRAWRCLPPAPALACGSASPCAYASRSTDSCARSLGRRVEGLWIETAMLAPVALGW